MSEGIIRLTLEIVTVSDDSCTGTIRGDNNISAFTYHFNDRSLELRDSSTAFTKLLNENIFQLRGILQTKRADTFFPGFQLDFSLEENFFEPDPEIDICVIDRKLFTEKRYFTKESSADITEVYCDGCYLPKKQCGGIAVLVKEAENKHNIYTERIYPASSNEAELLAAIRSLELTRNMDKIRMISDSRYVRKGLSKWLIHWKLNNWRTSNAETPKNTELWKLIDQLCDGRYLEFKWVKGHDKCMENIICDREAKRVAGKSVRNVPPFPPGNSLDTQYL